MLLRFLRWNRRQVFGIQTQVYVLHIVNGNVEDAGSVTQNGAGAVTAATIHTNGFSPFVFVKVASGDGIETADEDLLLPAGNGVDLSKVGTGNLTVTVTPSSIPLDRQNGSVKGKIDYKIPNTMKDASRKAYYKIPVEYLTLNDSASGNVYDASGRTIGSYTLNKETGDLVIQFTETFYNSHTDIEGYFNFNASVKTDAIENKNKVDLVFPGYKTVELSVKPGEVTGGKKGEFVYGEDGNVYVDYTVTLNADCDLENFEFTDELGENLEFVNDTFTFDDVAISPAVNGNTLSYNLDKISKGTHTFKCRAKVKSTSGQDSLINKASWKWKGGTTKEATDTRTINDFTISKAGGTFTGRTAKWTVRVTKGTYSTKEQMGRAKYEDTLPEGMTFDKASLIVKDTVNNKTLVEGTDYTLTETPDGKFSIQFTYTKPENVPSYEITYDTTLKEDENPKKDDKYNNTGTFTPEGEDGKSSSGSSTYDDGKDGRVPGTLTKHVDNVVYDETGNAISEWTLTIDPQGNTLTNVTVNDDFGNNGHTYKNTAILENSVKVLDKDGKELEFTYVPLSGVATVPYEEGYVYRFVIKLSDQVKEPITIKYRAKTFAEGVNSGEILVINNANAEWDGDKKDQAKDSFVFKKRTGKLLKIGRESGEYYRWDVFLNLDPATMGGVGNPAMDYGNDPIFFEDILPEGMELVTDAEHEPLYLYAPTQHYSTDWGARKNASGLYTYDNGRISVTFPKVGKSVVIFTYYTKIKDGFMDNEGDVTFTNNASYSDKDGVIDTGSYTIEKKGGTVTKDGVFADNKITYTVTINPKGVQLNDGKDLTFIDKIPDNCTYVPGTLTYKNGTALAHKYKDGTLTATIPDGTDLKLVYEVKVNGKFGENVTVTNTVVVRGKKEITSTDNRQVAIQETSAGASGKSDEISIHKVDEDNEEINLSGAKFKLQRMYWNEELQNFFDDPGNDAVQIETTNENGYLKFTGLLANTLYYYQELEAPSGYVLDSTKYYFHRSGNDDAAFEKRIQTAGIVAPEKMGDILVSNEAEEKGSLVIRKSVEGADATGKEFQFTVKGTDGKWYQGDGSASDTEYVLKVKANESITLSNLPVGTYTVEEKAEAAALEGYSLIATGTGRVTITKNSESVANVVNKYSQDKGSLVIRKSVEGADATGKEFQFTVKGTDGKWYQEDGNASDTEYVLKVKANESITLSNLPVGTYTVEEKAEAAALEGYSLIATGTGRVTITKNSESVANVVNKYSQDKGSLVIRKSVEGADATGKEFQFTVKGTDGKWYQEDGSASDTEYVLRVKANESITLSNLPVGTYTVEEKAAKAAIDGYSLIATGTGNVTVVKDETAKADVVNSYSQDKGSLVIRKSVEGADATGKEFQFTVKGTDGKWYQGDGSASDTEYVLKVKANESITLSNLPVGTYTVEEKAAKAAIDGYSLIATGTGNVTVVKDETAKADVVNSYSQDKGSLVIRKSVEGADATGKEFQFTVKGTDGKWYQGDGSASDTEYVLKVKANESITLSNLPVGTYTVEEKAAKAAIDGYSLIATGTGNIEVKKNSELVASVVNKYTPETTDISVTKVWEDNNNKAGVRPASIQVQLYADETPQGDSVELNEENSWKYTWKDLDKYADGTEISYRVDEVGETDGYLKSVAPNEDKTEYVITNTITSVKITKVDISDAHELEGAHLQILDSNGTVVAEWDSAKKAHEVTGLKTGELYTLRETVAPDGYTITTDTTFELDEHGKLKEDKTTTKTKDGVLLVEDTATSVKVRKVDITNDKELPGAHIQIWEKTGEGEKLVTEWDSTKEDKVVEKLKTNTTYILRETVAPDGYTITTDTTFELDEHGKLKEDKTTTNTKDGVLLVEDARTVEVSKVDLGTGEELDGAHIQVLDKAGNVVDEWDSKKGETHKVKNLTVGQEYTLRETVAPNGYTLTTDTTFTIDRTGKVTGTVTINKDGVLLVEDTATKAEITKLDAATEAPLSGAVLRVIDANGTAVDEWTTDGQPHVIEAKLNTGATYQLIEVKAPDGYEIADPISFTMKADGTTDPVVMKDAMTRSEKASVSVTKKLTFSGEEINAVDATFYVALYADEACTKRISEIMPLVFKKASSATVTFTNVEIGRTYYVGECDANGVNFVSGVMAGNVAYAAVFANGNKATVTEADGSTTVYFENQFATIPDGFYKEGILTITKKLLGSDKKAKNSNEVFYAGIFSDAAYTQLSGDVSENIVALDLAGGSEAEAEVFVAIAPGGSQTLYVTEVDANGKPVAGAAGFKYTVQVDKTSVTLSEANTEAHVTITNTETETETESETKKTTSVKTGDDTPIAPYMALMFASMAMLAAEFICRRKRRSEK